MESLKRTPDVQTFTPVPAKIVAKKDITEKETIFTMELPEGMSLHHKPMQFVMVSIFGLGEAPISITSTPSDDNTFDLCVRRVGVLTEALHAMSPGDLVGVRGPFGNGAILENIPGRDLLFVAGGLGLAPLRSLINQTVEHRDFAGNVTILYGCKNPDEQLFLDDIAKWTDDPSIEFHQTVDVADESWKGNVGVITTLFDRIKINPRTTTPVICGPPIMYKFVIMKLLAMGIPERRIYMSLERRMRCGLGRCGHCQINGVYVCQEGPVFTYADAKKFKEAL